LDLIGGWCKRFRVVSPLKHYAFVQGTGLEGILDDRRRSMGHGFTSMRKIIKVMMKMVV
jgi:hypothetical protein